MNLARTGGKVGHWVLPDGYYRCHEHSYWRCRCDVHHTLNVFPGTVFSRLRGQPTAMTLVSLVGALGQLSRSSGIPRLRRLPREWVEECVRLADDEFSRGSSIQRSGAATTGRLIRRTPRGSLSPRVAMSHIGQFLQHAEEGPDSPLPPCSALLKTPMLAPAVATVMPIVVRARKSR